jgi:hypothetical protein
MHILSVTVTNNPDPSCQRMKLTKRFEIEDMEDPTSFIRECITYTESMLKQVFPRGMTYTVPYTEVDVEEMAESMESWLLKSAYSSGQLQGTEVGKRIEQHFGVPFNHPSMDTRPEEPLLSESLGGYPVDKPSSRPRDESYVVDES